VVEYVCALSEWTERFIKVHRTPLPSSYYGTNEEEGGFVGRIAGQLMSVAYSVRRPSSHRWELPCDSQRMCSCSTATWSHWDWR